MFIGPRAVDGNELSRGKAAGDDFITRAQALRVLLQCNSIVRARIRAQTRRKGRGSGRDTSRERNREGRSPRRERDNCEREKWRRARGETTLERKREDSLGEYVDLHNDSPRDSSRYI